MANETRNTSQQDIGSGRSATELGVFEKYPPAQFTVAGQTLAFPVVRIQESGGNRVVKRERPYRDGAKLDDTGSVAKQWIIEALFENTIKEVDSINGDRSLYPDVVNDLIFLFDIHETGDLIVPTVGKQRVRAESYQRTEVFETRDSCVVTFTFTEDNEDSVNFRTITAPTANANARRLAETTTFDAQTAGSWDSSLNDLDEFTSSLETLVNSPGQVAQDVNQKAEKIDGNAQRANRAFKNASKPGRGTMLDPENSRMERKLVQQRDLAARTANESRRGRPRLLIVVFQENTNIFRVSALVQQDVMDLMDVNPLIDPLFIPALTPVKVFATEELLNGSRATAA